MSTSSSCESSVSTTSVLQLYLALSTNNTNLFVLQLKITVFYKVTHTLGISLHCCITEKGIH